jgi:hypothetical protein
MRICILALLATIPASGVQADPYCDVLLGYVHDSPQNAVLTKTDGDRSGQQTIARVPLPGARCLVTPYNPTGVAKDHPAEQSVYCFWRASDDKYKTIFDDVNTKIAACMDQVPLDDTFSTRIEYESNYGVIRVSADQMADDYAISVTVMPED